MYIECTTSTRTHNIQEHVTEVEEVCIVIRCRHDIAYIKTQLYSSEVRNLKTGNMARTELIGLLSISSYHVRTQLEMMPF